MRQARRDFLRRQSYRGRATRVRGHAGLVLTRRNPANYVLLWRERGVVYWIGTGTGRTVSLADLRTTAAALDVLEHEWTGSGGDPDLRGRRDPRHHAAHRDGLLRVGRQLHESGRQPGGRTRRLGLDVTLLPRSGERFAFDFAGRDTGSLQWNGQVSGTSPPAR